jgi:ParB family chromosome partitioning protein
MEFRYQSVRLDSINCKDTRFKITGHDASALLRQSIRQLGLINPPVVCEGPSDLRIVCGFNRITACRQLNMAEIYCRVLAADTPLYHCICIAIADNAYQRSLNLIEQARSVALLAVCYPDPLELVETANALGLAVNKDLVDKLLQVVGMSDLLKTGIAQGAIALPVALQLQAIHNASFSDELAILLIELDLSLNRQREVLDWILSICRRDNIDPCHLLSSGKIQNIREHKALDRKEKGRQIREILRKLRFPAITSHEQRFADTLARLKLSKGTFLIAPLHFESPIFSLKFDFQNRRELSDKFREFDRLNKSELIDSLWKDPKTE